MTTNFEKRSPSWIGFRATIKGTFIFLILTGILIYSADWSKSSAQTASLLPNAKQQFLDNSGKPLTSGKVYNYIPSTTTLKTTWQDAAETIPNTNPVILDAGGRAKILGDGSYRQIVKDRYDNIIWDAVTSSTGSGSSGSIATGDGDLVGTIKPWAGMTAPNQYAFTYGQEISRTTYAALFTAITSSQATFCTSASPVLSGLTDTTNFWVGMSVEISCVAAGFSTVVSKTSTTVTMAANANVTVNTTALFFPWGRGNGTTTFNLPDFRGVPIAGNNNMGGVASSNLTTTYFGATNPNSVGALGGSENTSITIVTANLPPYTPSGTNSTPVTGSFAYTNTAGGGILSALTVGENQGGLPLTGFINITTPTFTGTAQGGTSTPILKSIVQPTKTSNYIIKTTPDTNSATASGVTSLGGMTGDVACGTGISCTGNIISATGAGFLLAANNLSDVTNDNTSIYNLFNGQIVGYTPEMAGATQDGTNVTRYFASAATTISSLAGRRQLSLLSGAGYSITPIQFGGSNPATGTATGEIGPASTTLTVTSSPLIPITIGQSVTGAGVTAGTIVTGFGAKTNGGVGTYTVNNSQTAASTTLTFTAPSITASISGTTMTVSAIANGQLNLVDSLVGTDIIPGTTIVAQLTGSTGLTGTYTVSYSQTVASTTVRAYPYTVVSIPNAVVGAPGGQTATLLKGWGTNATPNSVIKIVDPPALGVVLGFEVGNFRVDGNSLYGSPLSFHGFSATSSGGVPWAHDIAVVNGTRDTCGVYVLGNAPAAISWGVIEAQMSRISSTSNAVCGFRFDGNSGTSNYNIQNFQADGLKANGNVTGNGIELDYTNIVCIACLGQSNGGVGFAIDHTNYTDLISAYTEGNSSGASTGTANSLRVNITGQLLEGVNATLQACGTCDIKIRTTGGGYRNDGNVTTMAAVTTSPTAGQGIVGASAGAGLQLFGRGATYDVALYNWGGSVACGVLTGTQQLDCNAFSIGGKTVTLAGNFAISGAFATTLTVTGATNVTLPTSGTLATTAGANIPAVAQGDLLYGSATNVLSALAKNTTATRYLSNTGSSNNPAWAQVNLANGVTGSLPCSNGGTAGTTTGAWLDVAYAAGDFTGSGAMTWTVEAGDVLTFKYSVVCKTMNLAFTLTGTSVGGVVDPALQIKIPGGYTASSRMAHGMGLVNDNGTQTTGWTDTVAAGSTVIRIFKTGSGNWTASANATSVYAVITFEIQ